MISSLDRKIESAKRRAEAERIKPRMSVQEFNQGNHKEDGSVLPSLPPFGSVPGTYQCNHVVTAGQPDRVEVLTFEPQKPEAVWGPFVLDASCIGRTITGGPNGIIKSPSGDLAQSGAASGAGEVDLGYAKWRQYGQRAADGREYPPPSSADVAAAVAHEKAKKAEQQKIAAVEAAVTFNEAFQYKPTLLKRTHLKRDAAGKFMAAVDVAPGPDEWAVSLFVRRKEQERQDRLNETMRRLCAPFTIHKAPSIPGAVLRSASAEILAQCTTKRPTSVEDAAEQKAEAFWSLMRSTVEFFGDEAPPKKFNP